MRLLISDTTAVDAALDRAISWPDDPPDPLAFQLPEIEILESNEAEIVGSTHVWYEPRLTALRRLIAEQQSWETR
jgi:hypothetical protein